MPIAFIKVNQGLLKEQKDKIRHDITQVIMNSMKLDESMVRVAFEEYAPENSFGNVILVIVHTIEGKTKDQKKNTVQGICEAIIDTTGMDISTLRVGFIEYPKDNYAIAGELVSEK